jgi:hypothetical protein
MHHGGIPMILGGIAVFAAAMFLISKLVNSGSGRSGGSSSGGNVGVRPSVQQPWGPGNPDYEAWAAAERARQMAEDAARRARGGV